MIPIYDPSRHKPLAVAVWNPPWVRDRVAAICRDAEAAFHTGHLWPMHPEDDDPSHAAEGFFRGLYDGAAGKLQALDRVRSGRPLQAVV